MQEKPKSQTAQREEETLAFWKEHDIFKKTLEKRAPKGEFVFYEGPPTANGHPAIHHLEARAFKDLIPRYKAMQGFHVRRRAGWDTHGLPVELEVEKELGLKNKKEIESYGIEKFNRQCKESVLRYIDEWKAFTDRIGFWVDHDQTYFTFTNDYIESIWSIMKRVNERGLLYKDYRVVPWCTRCGTPLSSHEVAEGYKEVTDTSVYVLFKLVGKDEYIAVWTTTPWTLPGNVALAVGEHIIYARTSIYGSRVWMAKERVSVLFPDTKIEEEKKGSELVGLAYEPLASYMKPAVSEREKEKLGNAFKIYAADFVGATDGTGIVHIAPMYGSDDFVLGTANNLPKYHVVNEEGKFIDAVKPFAGMFVKKADKEIIKELGDKVLRTEDITHSYPHCWRCKSPLIYYARDSWYIRMSQLRDQLVSENQKVHWEPEHMRDGRFGEWLKEAKDWAISRNRYWGTPLPIWRSASGKTIVVGSYEELKEKTKRSGNRYFIMRHGEAESNIQNIYSSDITAHNPLTERGKEQVRASAEKLRGATIDHIFCSPFERAHTTANIVRETLGLPESILTADDRLGEVQYGEMTGSKRAGAEGELRDAPVTITKAPKGGETLTDVKRRMGLLLREYEKNYAHKTILIVTHGGCAWMMHAAARGLALDEEHTRKDLYPATAEIFEISYTPLPVNENFELDVHRPYIDAIQLEHDGEMYERVPEVMDVWFDSGAMPFAQDHYPFENKEWIDGAGYPADFISEAIDQTRGWFYTLLCVGVLMERGTPYKNVICLGHLLDDKGKKMSKSSGNVINPWDVLPKYGADALRYWMYTVNEPGTSKNFDERLVDEIVKKHIGRLLNVLSFYELFKDTAKHTAERGSEHVLDRWIIARLNALILSTTENLDAYKIDKAARPLADFIDDLSTWYLRRSRERIKGDDQKDVKAALSTLACVLHEYAKVIAPFMPFVAEHLYRTVGGKKESVHLEDWPTAEAPQESTEALLEVMQKARGVVSLGLEFRANAKIKVRQPLQKATIKEMLGEEMAAIVRDELNVKEVIFDSAQSESITLDTTLTDALKQEGETRELLRAVQELRKKKGLKPGEKVILVVGTSVVGRTRVEESKSALMKSAALSGIEYDSVSGDALTLDGYEVRMKLK
ncbi:class I tRNA ligase family protein [Candidatus Kaiserbacteria bacterium]|nr:class I tRNA ligase family protein [Candidatus Kaiserbacteria bacterium]